MIMMKLDDFALNSIHTLLIRNPFFKLTQDDYNFIRPPSSAPNRCVVFPLSLSIAASQGVGQGLKADRYKLRTGSGSIEHEESFDKATLLDQNSIELDDPYLFLRYFKQNACSFLHTLNTTAVSDSLPQVPAARRSVSGTPSSTLEQGQENFMEPFDPIDEFADSSSTTEHVVEPSDYFFVYNLSMFEKQQPDKFKKFIDTRTLGLATVYLSVIDAEGNGPCTTFNSSVDNPGSAQSGHFDLHTAMQRTFVQIRERGAKVWADSGGYSSGYSSKYDSMSSDHSDTEATAHKTSQEQFATLTVSPFEIFPVPGGVSKLYRRSETEPAEPFKLPQPTVSPANNSANDASRGHSRWKLLVEVWTRGVVDTDKLLTRIRAALNHAFHDYLIETFAHSHRAQSSLLTMRFPGSSFVPPKAMNQNPLSSVDSLPLPAHTPGFRASQHRDTLSFPGSSIPTIPTAHQEIATSNLSPVAQIRRDNLLPYISLMSSSLAQSSGSVQRLKVDIPFVNKWGLVELLKEIKSIVGSLNPYLTPTPFVSTSRSVLKTTHSLDPVDSANPLSQDNVQKEFEEMYEVVALGEKSSRPEQERCIFNPLSSDLPSSYLLLGGFFGEEISKDAKPSGKPLTRGERIAKLTEKSEARDRIPETCEPRYMHHGHITYECRKISCFAATTTPSAPVGSPISAMLPSSSPVSSSVVSRRDSSSTPRFSEFGAAAVHTHLLHRNSFVIILCSDLPRRLTVWTYNWQKEMVTSLTEKLSYVLSWCNMRQTLTQNILSQKLGLFYHAPSSYSRKTPVIVRNLSKRRVRDRDSVLSRDGSFAGKRGMRPELHRRKDNPTMSTERDRREESKFKVQTINSLLGSSSEYFKQVSQVGVPANGNTSAANSAAASANAAMAALQSKHAAGSKGQITPAMMRSYLALRKSQGGMGRIPSGVSSFASTAISQLMAPDISKDTNSTQTSSETRSESRNTVSAEEKSALAPLPNLPFLRDFGCVLKNLANCSKTFFVHPVYSSHSPYEPPSFNSTDQAPPRQSSSRDSHFAASVFSEDPVQFHGKQFHHLVFQQVKKLQKKDVDVESQRDWHKFATMAKKGRIGPPVSYLDRLFEESRGLQVIRVPLLFNDKEQSGQWGQKETSLYLTAIMESFLKEYIKYLSIVLGTSIAAIDDESNSMTSQLQEMLHTTFDRKEAKPVTSLRVRESNFSSSPNPTAKSSALLNSVDGDQENVRTVTPVKVHLFKIVQGFTLLMQLSFEFVRKFGGRNALQDNSLDIFTCSNISLAPFSKLPEHGGFAPSKSSEMLESSPVEPSTIANVIHEVIGVYNLIHFNSFAYDFHLRHFVSYVMDPSAAYPSFNLKHTLSSFQRFYPNPPAHSRNHVIHCYCRLRLHAEIKDQEHFFGYMTQHARKYGIGNVSHRDGQKSIPTLFLSSLAEGGEKFEAITPSQLQGILDSNTVLPPCWAKSTFLYLFICFLTSPEDIQNAASRGEEICVHNGDDDLYWDELSETDRPDEPSLLNVRYYFIRVDRITGNPLVYGHKTGYSAQSELHNRGTSTRRSEDDELTSAQQKERELNGRIWNRLSEAMKENLVLAESVFRVVVNKALMHYQRDMVWEKIYRPAGGLSKPPAPHSVVSPSISNSSLNNGKQGDTGSGNLAENGGTDSSVANSKSANNSMVSMLEVEVSMGEDSAPQPDPLEGVIVLEDFGEEDYESFRSLCFRRPLEVVDPSLLDLASVGLSALGAVLGPPLSTYLCALYKSRARLLQIGDTTNLFIFHQHNKDLMLHIIIHIPRNTPINTNVRSNGTSVLSSRLNGGTVAETECAPSQFKVFSCRRELVPSSPDDAGGNSGMCDLDSEQEREMLTQFVNQVCHFMWTQLL